jgi:hypothetical protein
MKRRVFVLPNFVVTVRFLEADKDAKLVLHATDQQALEVRLKARYPLLQIKKVATYDFATAWGKKAGEKKVAVDLARAKNEKYDFNKNAIWGDLKEYLFDLFDQHCAYCECDLLSDNPGAVEHYRPKNPVLDDQTHPGYFWLAYEATNYLPTCTRCNSAKSNFFPLAPGSPRATAPGEEKNEQPLLLNPWLLGADLEKHLAFVSAGTDQAGPVAKGISEEGKESVKRLGLNRPELVPKRLYEQERAVIDYMTQRASGLKPPPVLEHLKAGSRPYSAAALTAIAGVEKGFPSLG